MSFEDFKNLVKDRVDISTVIGKHAKLVRTPRGWKACCPLPGHKENTPSFNIDKQKNLYYCYGCNRGGDVFKFMEALEGLSFFEALKELAATVNVEVPKNLFKQPQQSQQQKGRLDLGYELLDRAAKFYSRVLQSAKGTGPERALSYLDERGITFEEIESLGLGWSPEGGDALASKIREPAEREVALSLGLIRQSGGQPGGRHYDFFRGRLMIPILDPRGRVIGFSGRTLEPVSGTNPKYINSSESDWFKKKNVIYGIDRATKFVREEGFVAVVEGYFDQWAFHRHEIPAVAVMGTALTEEHLIPLGRATKKIVLVMDSDKAGIASTKKSLPLFFRDDWDVRVFQGFAGKDPDEWLKENAAKKSELVDLLSSAPEGFVWLAKTLLHEGVLEKWNRTQLLDQAARLWPLARSEPQRTALFDELEPHLGQGYDRAAVRRDLTDRAARATGTRGDRNEEARVANVPMSAATLNPMLSARAPSFGRTALQQRTGTGSRAISTFDRASEEAVVWWLWHWEQLSPKNTEEWNERVRLFEGTLGHSLATASAKYFAEQGKNLTLEELARVLDTGDFEPEVRTLLYRGLVRPDNEDQREDDKVLISFRELGVMLDREKTRAKIALLRNELRVSLADKEKTAQLLRDVQALSLRLEKFK